MLARRPATRALILAGGRGARLGALTDGMPKPLLPVAGRPFLEYLILHLVRQCVTDITLSVGYLARAVMDALGDGNALGARLAYSVEETPLGTGGAVRLAVRRFAEPFFVLNGDTLFDCPLRDMERALPRGGARGLLFLRRLRDAGRFGCVRFDPLPGAQSPFGIGRILSFTEKAGLGPGLINAGVYLLHPNIMEHIPEGASSLEHETFPLLAARGELFGLPHDGFFLDMGLPESYAVAQKTVPAWLEKQKRWSASCRKFQSWNQIQVRRRIYNRFPT